jgi:hypothetical protein
MESLHVGPQEFFWKLPYKQIMLILNSKSGKVATSEELLAFMSPFVKGGEK